MKAKELNKVFTAIFMAGFVLSAGAAEDSAVFRYDAKGRRDPFVPLVGVAGHVEMSGIAGVTSIDDVKLQGVVYDREGRRRAVINGELMSEGDSSGVITVVSIEDGSVTVSIGENNYKIDLYK